MAARRAGILLAKLALALGISALVWHLAGGMAALVALKAADPVWLGAAGLALTVQTVTSAARWRLTAGRLGIALPWPRVLREYYLAQFINQVLPGGVLGDAGRAVRARGAAGLLASAQAVVFERAVGQIALLAVLALGLAVTIATPGGLDWPAGVTTALPWAGLALLAASGVVWATRARLPDALRAQSRAFAKAVTAPGVLWPQLALSLLAALCNIAGFGFCAWAVGAPLTVPAMLAVVPLILLAMVIPLTIAGWGLREGAAVALLPFAGVSPAAALATSIAFGLVFLVTTLPGAVVLTRFRSHGTIKS